MTVNTHAKGDREKALRNKFKAEWAALPRPTYLEYFDRACVECKVKNVDEIPPGLIDCLNDYAWTLFAEEQDPEEAKRIRNVGSYTTQDAFAGAAPEGGW